MCITMAFPYFLRNTVTICHNITHISKTLILIANFKVQSLFFFTHIMT
jgi:hypothetical protein